MDNGKDGLLGDIHRCTGAIATNLACGRVQAVITGGILTIKTITTILTWFATFKA
jgi:hypothetical protein